LNARNAAPQGRRAGARRNPLAPRHSTLF